jgi:NADH-ubiquinone oxidoreductase chain 6
MSFSLSDLIALTTTIMAVLVITATSPIVAVVYLIGVFVLAACYLFCKGLSYIGLTYLVVYVGAVAVLFLFVIMMFNVEALSASGIEFTQGIPLTTLLGLVFILEAMSVIPSLTTAGSSLLLGLLSSGHGLVLGVSPVSQVAPTVVYYSEAPDAAFNYLSQIQSLGLAFYTHGTLWLILIGLLLLMAMLGPITLCLRKAS